MLIPTSYEELDDDEKIETVLTNKQNSDNNYNVVSDSKSYDKAKESSFEEQLNDKLKWL